MKFACFLLFSAHLSPKVRKSHSVALGGGISLQPALQTITIDTLYILFFFAYNSGNECAKRADYRLRRRETKLSAEVPSRKLSQAR